MVVGALKLGRFAVCLGLAVVSLALGAAAPSAIVGPASVVDGDTLTVAGVRIRIWGIDAPEGRQSCQYAGGRRYACGEVSTARMRKLVAAGDVTCVVRDHDQYGRSVSQCRAGAQDLGAVMVSEGLAVEYRQFDGGAYAPAEAQARQAKRGLWAGTFEPRLRGGRMSGAGTPPRPRLRRPAGARPRATSTVRVCGSSMRRVSATTPGPVSIQRRASAGFVRLRRPQRRAGLRLGADKGRRKGGAGCAEGAG